MPSFREIREALLFGYYDNILNDQEFLLLYDLHRSRNPDFPYWRYAEFDLDKLNEVECIANFRFKKNDIYVLKELFQIPDEEVCYNRSKLDGIEALCIFLERYAYPVRYGSMVQIF